MMGKCTIQLSFPDYHRFWLHRRSYTIITQSSTLLKTIMAEMLTFLHIENGSGWSTLKRIIFKQKFVIHKTLYSALVFVTRRGYGLSVSSSPLIWLVELHSKCVCIFSLRCFTPLEHEKSHFLLQHCYYKRLSDIITSANISRNIFETETFVYDFTGRTFNRNVQIDAS